MEGRLSNKKAERDKGEIKQEATASSPPIPPLEDEDEPPPLEEAIETYSKASTPGVSSRLSGEGLERVYSTLSDSKRVDSPLSYTDRVRSRSSSYAEEAESPSSYTENAHSPAPYSEPHSPPRHVSDPRHKGVVENNNISAHNDPSPKHRGTDNGHTKAGIGSNTTTVPPQKLDAKSSIRSSIPSITQSVVSAAKHVSFKSRSLSSRSSPAVYGSTSRWRGSARQMKIVEVGLRFGGAVLALITFSVMAATSERREGAGSTFKMKFTDYQAYNYLVAVNIISFLYSCLQLVLLGQSRIGGFFTNTRDSMLFTYVADQVLAFLLFSASTAAATAAQLSRRGLHNIWPPACSTWKLWHFCTQADAAVVMSFFSSFFVIASAVFSGYHISHSLLE